MTVTVVRYNNAGMVTNNYNNYYGYGNSPFGFGFGGFGGFGGYGGYGYGNGNGNDDSSSNPTNGTLTVGGGFTTMDIDVTLEVLDD